MQLLFQVISGKKGNDTSLQGQTLKMGTLLTSPVTLNNSVRKNTAPPPHFTAEEIRAYGYLRSNI